MVDDITKLIIDLIKEPLTQLLSAAGTSFVSGLAAAKVWSPKVLSDKDFKIVKETTKIEILDNDNSNGSYVYIIVTRKFDMQAKASGKYRFRREIAAKTKGEWNTFTLNGGTHLVKKAERVVELVEKIPFKQALLNKSASN